MPVTQDRLIALTNAGRDFEQGFNFLLTRCAQIATAISKGKITIGDVQLELSGIDGHFLLRQPQISSNILATEYDYLTRIAKHNDRARDRATRKRREAGILPRLVKRSETYMEEKTATIEKRLAQTNPEYVAVTSESARTTEQELTKVWNEAQAAKSESQAATTKLFDKDNSREVELPNIPEQDDSPF